uniref:Lipocalin/cytosolic fatty-acid binding domain-containing protein n=1 Tax=Clastoptera arizonana TaxID=38151 RepID=A0A1B6DEL9_9HEMI
MRYLIVLNLLYTCYLINGEVFNLKKKNTFDATSFMGDWYPVARFPSSNKQTGDLLEKIQCPKVILQHIPITKNIKFARIVHTEKFVGRETQRVDFGELSDNKINAKQRYNPQHVSDYVYTVLATDYKNWALVFKLTIYTLQRSGISSPPTNITYAFGLFQIWGRSKTIESIITVEGAEDEITKVLKEVPKEPIQWEDKILIDQICSDKPLKAIKKKKIKKSSKSKMSVSDKKKKIKQKGQKKKNKKIKNRTAFQDHYE